jgi:geranylgeranyl pyrophosphate synthase
MDDDDMRRGRPTLHVHAGEAMAILAGDAMISIAFELLSETDVAPADAVRLVGELARATTAMVGGQVYDTLGGLPAGLSDEEQLALIHRSKTGALLRAACRMGAICGGASDHEMKRLDRFGEALGLMFQIVDDLLDVTQSSEHIGKAAGKDVSKGKLTYPGLLGIERSRRDVDRLRVEAIDALSAFGRRADPLRALAADMAVRTR